MEVQFQHYEMRGLLAECYISRLGWELLYAVDTHPTHILYTW